MNKKGMGAGILVIIMLLIVGLGVGGYFLFTGESQSIVSQDQLENPLTCSDSTGILTVQSRSILAGAAAPSGPTITCGIDGGVVATSVTSGTTTFPVGADLECLVSKSDYIDKSFKFTMPCGGKTLDGALYYSTSDNPAIRIKNDDGDYVTDAIAGGATNQTDLSAGETLVMEVEFTGTATEASGKGVYVIEFPAGSASNITKVELGSLKSVAIPTVHTLQNAGSKAVAFEVPNIVDGDRITYPLTVTLVAADDLGGGVYTDWYGGQEFIDDDYTIQEGVEDSDGTAKYENTLDFDFLIASS